MNQCPLAYVDPCTECARFGTCSPSKAVQRLDELEEMLKEMKKMIEYLASDRAGTPTK